MAPTFAQLADGWKMSSEKSKAPMAPCSTLSYGINAFDVEVEMARSLINTDPNARPKYFANVFEETVFVFTVMMATASTTLLQGVIIINTGSIGRDLIMTSAEIAWIAAAIGLTSGSFVLFFGKTADLFGRKIQIVFGTALLSLFSLITSFAPGPMSMLIFCGLLGIGTAMIGPPSIGILLATYPEGQRRNRVTGALGAGNPLGFILGSISSGLATKYWSWRSSFLVIAMFFLVMTTLVVWTVPTIPRAGNRKKMVRQFDYLGAGFMIGGMALISAALTEGPELGWNSFKVILMLLIGVFCIVGFWVWETLFPYPLLNPDVWTNKTFTLCVLSVSFGYMSFITNEFWIALYMQDIQHFAPLHIAALLLPQALAGVIWSYLGQSLVSKISGTLIMAMGGFAYLSGAIILIFIKEDTSYWMILFPAMLVTVIGADFQFIVSNLYVNKQMPSQSSLAAGVLQTGRSLSIPIGLAITFAVYGSMSETREGRSNPNFAYHRVYICTILFAVISLLFIPFMKIEKQGSEAATPSIASSSTTVVNERAQPAQTDGATDHVVAEQPTGNSHSLAQKPSDGSLFSAATAGSFDSYFPRWSWEQLRRWPDDMYKLEADNVVYEVCIKCLQERKVLVRTEKDGNEDLLNEGPDLTWDVEWQHGHSITNIPVQEYSYIDGIHDSNIRSSGGTVPSLAHLQNRSMNTYGQSRQSWISEMVEQRAIVDNLSQPVSPTRLQRTHNNNSYPRVSPKVHCDNPVTRERVLFNGYPSQNTAVFQPVQSSRRLSNNEYRLSLVDAPPVPMPELPPAPLPSNPPMAPNSSRGGRIWINRSSTQTIPPQYSACSFRDGDASFEFPTNILGRLGTVKESPKRHKIKRPISSVISPIKSGENFTTIELTRNNGGPTRQSEIGAPPRVLNSREMAMHYSARPIFKRDRGETNTQVFNAGGYEQRSVASRWWV